MSAVADMRAVAEMPGANAVPSEGADATSEEQRRRRRRRGGRGNRDEAGPDAGADAGGDALAPAAAPADPAAAAVDGGATDPAATDGAEPAEQADTAERDGARRRGRGRERGRREPRPLLDENGQPIAADTATEPAADTGTVVPMADDTAPASPVAAPEPAPHPAASPAPAAPAAAAAPRPMAAVAPFVLPIGDLQQLAEASGLQWVNSDGDKIRAAQAAMAAEPAPAHVPRERKPVLVQDDGPLVLVETRKDLSQLKLPFEHGAPPA